MTNYQIQWLHSDGKHEVTQLKANNMKDAKAEAWDVINSQEIMEKFGWSTNANITEVKPEDS